MKNAVNKREFLELAETASGGTVAGSTTSGGTGINRDAFESTPTGPHAKAMTIRGWWKWLWDVPVDGPRATALLRLMVGSVFLWEGIMKFVFANQGIGRFTKLGFPFPGPTADLVAVIEIVGGTFLLAGLQTRLVGIVFVVEMIVAVLSTKVSMFLGTSPLPLPPVPPQIGFWAVLHEVRSEFAQMFVSLFLLLQGPGRLSLDAWRKTRGRRTTSERERYSASAVTKKPVSADDCRSGIAA